jgi:hypothetical protein
MLSFLSLQFVDWFKHSKNPGKGRGKGKKDTGKRKKRKEKRENAHLLVLWGAIALTPKTTM